jgi:hypothetical protein
MMVTTMRRTIVLILTMLVLGSLTLPALAEAPAAVKMNWKVVPLINATIKPNYQSGFGPTGGNGSGVTPAVGSTATLNGGNVDFGQVVAGFEYLYKFAAQISVTTNDASGFNIYGEASSNFNGTSTGTFSLAGVLFYLPNSTGNTAFSPGTAFGVTTSPVSNAGKTITYTGAPPLSALVFSSPIGGTLSEGYDYQLRLPGTMPTDTFNVIVVYTVIGN